MVSFRKEDRERVASGEITVTFRLWKSAHVKAGKTYEAGGGAILVDDVRMMPAALISEEDVRRSGCASAQAVRDLAGEHTGTHVGPETLLYRVEFRFMGDTARRVTDATQASPDHLARRLARMDRLSSHGPWTLATLALIEAAPGVPARVLAGELGQETADFKANVRKLKALGLTVSHEVGYDLTLLGQACLDFARHQGPGRPSPKE